MAAPLVLTPAQQELISSLGQDDIPIKLRCAIDSRLAVNAFRLPCCDQSICESCHSTLPSTCPVCEHSPVSAADCKPNKSLRTTIKVFLRTEEKKRETARSKEANESVPPTPVVDVPPTPIDVPVVASHVDETSVETVAPIVEETPQPAPAEEATEALLEVDDIKPKKEEQDVPHATIEEISADQEPVATEGDENAVTADNENGVVQLKGQTDGQEESEVGLENAAAGFPGMMGADMNQMQMFMAMQNGMGAGGFGNFPMMGMPGMGMDPMTMQNMFMNGGFGGAGGMGMNGMNMGMGMGGFNAGTNTGFNNWNGQQNSWNIGQDNYNHPNAAGMMGHGDYRANNSGFAQNAQGFNHQGNYGRSQYNDFNNNNSYGNNNFGFRGRGRGRGGFGRGGFGHQDFSHQQQQQNFGQNQNVAPSETGSTSVDAKPAGNVDEFGRELRPTSEARDSEKPEDPATVNGTDTAKETTPIVNNHTSPENNNQEDHEQYDNQDGGNTMPIQSLDQNNAAFNQMNGGYGYNAAYAQPYGSRNGFNAMQPPVVKPDVPINAPKGPKAMREGLPNVGFRGRQFPSQPAVQPNIPANGSVNGSVRAGSEVRGERQKSRSPTRERSRERSREPSHSREQSQERSGERRRSRSREHRHRRHRHRSESVSEDEKETQRRRERRRERRQRREEEDARGEIEENIEDDRDNHEKKEDENRSRSASPSDHKRSSHRSSRRDKEKYRDRERESDRDRDHKSSSHKHRSHRSHREDRSRSRDRDRDRDREHRRRHSRRGSVDPAEASSVPITPIVEQVEPLSRKQSVVSNHVSTIEIKGASSRRKAQDQQSSTATVIPTGPRSDRDKEKSRSHHVSSSSSRHHNSETRSSRDNRDRNHHQSSSSKPEAKASTTTAVDPHTLEREARNRERLLKEAQRIAGMAGGFDRKRSRDDGTDGGGERKSGGSRKKGRRGGVIGEEDEESRLARLEAERESARWS